MHTILVIDDDPVIMEIISELLSDQYLIVKAKNADDGLKIIREVSLDLIITDHQMPGYLTGLTLAKTLCLENNPVPIIMISGANVQTAAYSWGVKEYLVKPFDLDQIKVVVDTYLQPKLRLLA